MNTQIVKRMLKQISEVPKLQEQRAQEEANRRRQRRRENAADEQPLNEKEVFDRQVQNILLLDDKMASRSGGKQKSLQRITAKQKRESTARKISAKLVVGNSRSSSASGIRRKPEKTSDKKKHNEQKAQKKMKAIAKLLQKQSITNKQK